MVEEFFRINRSIKPWNYRNLSLLSETNIIVWGELALVISCFVGSDGMIVNGSSNLPPVYAKLL